MSAVFKVFTPEAIALIREMKGSGARSAEIARAIGTTANSLNARCSQLKIKRPKRRDMAA
jgi:hypothetical protein